MAKARKNVVVRGISGSFWSLVFRQMPDGSTYISAKHDFSKLKLSEKQKEQNDRFREAVRYARQAARSQPIYAQMAAGTILSPYNIAMADWFHGPIIHEAKREEGCIRIWVTDNVMVSRVIVTILDEQGVISERGEGVKVSGIRCQVSGGWWEYAPTREGRVKVEAWDLAGNVTNLVIE